MQPSIRYLTPDEIARLDPTGKARAKLASYVDSKPTPTPAPFSHLSREQWLQNARAIRNSIKGKRWDEYKSWDESLESKYGAQGGTFSVSYLHESYSRSYEFAKKTRKFKLACIGRDFLLALISDSVRKVGYPSPIPAYIGTTGTSSGLPVMGRKGSFLPETVGMSHWRHVIPDLPGERFQRQKRRCINMDANSNVRYIEEYLARVRSFLRSYLKEFASWRRPDEVEQPAIYYCLSHGYAAVGFDYDHCDESFSLETSIEIVLPIYEFLLSPMEFARLASCVEELFHQEIFFGSYCMTGLHNLLSGEVITNDFETIYDICVGLGVLLTTVGYENGLVMANGDDVLIFVKRSLKLLQQVRDAYINEALQNGMIMSAEKCDIYDTGHVKYLRRFYCNYPTLYNSYGQPYSLGAYPIVLTYNSIFCPERFAKSDAEIMQSTLQRLDNQFGGPAFSTIVGSVLSQWKVPLPQMEEVASLTAFDWWMRLYGTSWDLKTSNAYKTAVRLKLLPQV